MNSSRISDSTRNSILVEPVQVCAACGTHVDVSEFEPLHNFACPECSADFTVRGRVGRFALISRLGRGGMGLAYEAFDPDLKRRVAVKLLRREHAADAEGVAQMQVEAQIMGVLKDANVVQVYTSGKHGDRVYIVMELVSGGSLDDRMTKRGALPEGEVIEMAIQVASGLAAAHRAGLVHRDVKPGNILFTSDGVAKVADFGLSVLAVNAADAAGDLRGTPYYVPPERVSGKVEDFRGDIYALGATLFHALAGRPVFEGSSGGEIAMKHLSNPPPSVLAFAPRVSPVTARVIARMLQKSPRSRHVSYEELISEWQVAKNEILRAQKSVPVAKKTECATYRAKGFPVSAAISLIAGALVLGSVLLFAGGKRKPAAGVDPKEEPASAALSAKARPKPVAPFAEASKQTAEKAAPQKIAASTGSGEVMLIDDGFPAGANMYSTPPDLPCTWVTKADGPVARGTRALRVRGPALAQFSYRWGALPFEVPADARVSVEVFLDPANPPRAIMLQMHTDAWRHRVLWGNGQGIPFGTPNTAERYLAGALPAMGRWVKLDIPTNKLNLKPGELITGIAFTQEGGTAYFDALCFVTASEKAGSRAPEQKIGVR